MSKNAEGWIRHRGGKCPVDAGVKVDYRMRCGSVDSFGRKSYTLEWDHYNEGGDIMAYKLHKPAEQVEACSKPELQINLPDGYGEIYSAQAVEHGPIQWRDRIAEIDVDIKFEEDRYNANMACMNQERAELVQKLASEGFALIGRVVEPVEDMSDWRNWKVGDRLVLTASGLDDCERGEMLTIDGIDFDDDNQPIGAQNDNGNHHWPILKHGHFKTLTWHSRPSA